MSAAYPPLGDDALDALRQHVLELHLLRGRVEVRVRVRARARVRVRVRVLELHRPPSERPQPTGVRPAPARLLLIDEVELVAHLGDMAEI